MDASILIFLGISFAAVVLFKRLNISPMIAFLLAGIVAGPHGFGLYETSGAWTYLGSLGMMFLWFTLGLELNIKRLWVMHKNIFGFGAAQVLVVCAFLFPVIFGITDWSLMGVIMVCLILAMSSSGTNLQMLADRNELQTGLGRQTFSILLFQDLLSIPLLAMLPVFAGKSFNFGARIIDVSVMTIGLILGVIIIARLIMNPLMRAVSKLKSKEAFLLVILLIIVGCAALFNLIGMPAGIGAFLAGMLFSETIYNYQVRADIDPYKILFLSLFFLTLGMGLDLTMLFRNIWIVLGGAAALVLTKFFAIYIVARIRQTKHRDAFLVALILAEGGEFGLLILQTLRIANIEAIPMQHIELLIAIIIISMVLSSVLLSLYDLLNEKGLLYSLKKANKYNKEISDKKPSIVICGFGRVGMTIVKMLDIKKISYVAIDMNVDSVLSGREAGLNIVYGDTTRSDVLTQFGLAPRTTRAVIVALDNEAAQKKTVRAVRHITKNVKIFARARNLAESDILISEGARVALPETIESSFLLGQGVLAELGVSKKEIENILSKMRKNNYKTIDSILG